MNSVWDLLVSAIVLSYKYIQLNIFNENLDIWVWSSRKRAEREQASECLSSHSNKAGEISKGMIQTRA